MLNQVVSILSLPIIGNLLKLALLLVLLLLFGRVLDAVVRRIEKRLEGRVTDVDRRRRLDTLLRAGQGIATVVVLALALTMALELFGFNIGPLLASAGVAGLAVSLGATTMIQDYIGGVIILSENQFRVGDVVEVGGVAGEVVRMTMRATYLRDANGKLFTVPNGSIRVISNLTRDWARAVVDLTLDYDADPARLDAALHTVMAQLKADASVNTFLLGEPETVTWSNLTEWGVQLRIMAKTLPGKQWAVGRMLRRYAVEALQAQGLHIAFPISRIRDERLPLPSQPPDQGESKAL
jgi:small-conductance mechanosensitive channel